MTHDNPFAKLGGALDQKLFQETTPKSSVPLVETTEKAAGPKPQAEHAPTPAIPPTKPFQKEKPQNRHDTMIPRHHDTAIPRTHDTVIPGEAQDIFEAVRKSVKQIGKEAATHRFTLDEKNLLADIEYTYKRQGIRTSENEITRIAINYFIEDYRLNGEESLLANILKRLNS
jgi:hypothetical protein